MPLNEKRTRTVTGVINDEEKGVMRQEAASNVHVAVVIPVRNRSDLLERCLASLADQVFSMAECEVLVCDDCSQENLRPILNRFREKLPRIRLLRQDSWKGPAAARNFGIRAVGAPIVLFLDSDTLSDHALVRHLLAALDRNPEWVGAEAKIESVGRKENPLWDGPVCPNGGRYHTAAIAYRRDALIRAGGLDETFKMPACEDVDLAMRLLKEGSIGFVPEAIVYHPTRRVTLKTFWNWRRYWKYVMILAKRYGVLAFPGKSAGSFPRLRVALAAVLTLPGGRFLTACDHLMHQPWEGLLACFYAFFEAICGVCALPDILFESVPPYKDYLSSETKDSGGNLTSVPHSIPDSQWPGGAGTGNISSTGDKHGEIS